MRIRTAQQARSRDKSWEQSKTALPAKARNQAELDMTLRPGLEHFLRRLRLVRDEHQPGHNRRLDGDSHERGE